MILQERPANAIRGLAYGIATHRYYVNAKGAVFLAFLIIMSAHKSDMSDFEQKTLKILQYSFLVLLLIEYIIEFLALGIRS